MFQFIKDWFRPKKRKSLSEMIDEELEKQIPIIVVQILTEKFEKSPNVPLTRVGFHWALVLGFENIWPDLGRKGAIACANDCMEYLDDMPEDDWTAANAKLLVEEYARDYGE